MTALNILGFTDSESMVINTVIHSNLPLSQKDICDHTGLSIGITSSALNKAKDRLGIDSQFSPEKNCRVFYCGSHFEEKISGAFLRQFQTQLKLSIRKFDEKWEEEKSNLPTTESPSLSENAKLFRAQISDSSELLNRVISLSKWE